MPRIKDIHSFTVPSEDANSYDINYSEIIGGISGCTMLVNNTLVNVAPQSSFILRVNTLSATTGCYLGGERPWFESGKSFISTWLTSNTSAGSSTATQIKLPLVSTGTYDFIVEWGDGSSSKITSWNQAETTHTYATSGVYKMRITGQCYGWSFGNAGDILKILSIEQWGTGFRLGNNTSNFYGCANLRMDNIPDVLDLTNTTDFSNLFRNCSGLITVGRINDWNVSNITNTLNCFAFCNKFNSEVGRWNVANVTNMNYMFGLTPGSGVFNNGGNPSIENWNTSKVINMTAMFQNQPYFNQPINTKAVTVNNTTYTAWDVSNVTNFGYMLNNSSASIRGLFNQDIGNWNTSKNTNLQQTFYGHTSFNQDIGTKVVTVNGVSYIAWDTANVIVMANMIGANSNISPGNFNNGGSDSIKNWNTSKVASLTGAFNQQVPFNQPINTNLVTISGTSYVAWDVARVANFSGIFNISGGNLKSEGLFNQDIGNWNTSAATNTSYMFYGQPNFDQNIGTKVVTVNSVSYSAWTLNNNLNMIAMLYCPNTIKTGVFNNGGSDSIKIWNTAKVTNISFIFQNQALFNQEIGTWNTGLVTNMERMFYCDKFTGIFNNGGSSSINNLNITKSTNISNVFYGQTNFNQPLSGWTTSAATTTRGCFYGANSFNQNINNWNTSKVTDMSYMFGNSSPNISKFNQPLSGWVTTSVSAMTAMFNYATDFNQNIGNWNVSGVTIFDETLEPYAFMKGKTYNDYSTDNYDALLIGWASRTVKPNLVITFGTIKYTSAAVSARNILTSAPNNWTIIDGGLA